MFGGEDEDPHLLSTAPDVAFNGFQAVDDGKKESKEKEMKRRPFTNKYISARIASARGQYWITCREANRKSFGIPCFMQRCIVIASFCRRGENSI
jgi:hypothetical protein